MFPTNYVQINYWSVSDNWLTRMGAGSYYKSFVSTDLTDDAVSRSSYLTDDLNAYLNQFFPGWRLRREVIERTKQHSPTRASRWKEVFDFFVVETDADAETLASHLRKTKYKTPADLEQEQAAKWLEDNRPSDEERAACQAINDRERREHRARQKENAARRKAGLEPLPAWKRSEGHLARVGREAIRHDDNLSDEPRPARQIDV